MGGRPNGAYIKKTERKLKSPLWAPRITEQPRRHGSSARCVRDPMTQACWPGGGCRSCGTIPRKSSRSPGLFRVVPHDTIWTTVITLQTPPVTHAPQWSSVQVGCRIAGCAFAQHMVSTADKGPRLVDISLVAINFRVQGEINWKRCDFYLSLSGTNIVSGPVSSIGSIWLDIGIKASLRQFDFGYDECKSWRYVE